MFLFYQMFPKLVNVSNTLCGHKSVWNICLEGDLISLSRICKLKRKLEIFQYKPIYLALPRLEHGCFVCFSSFRIKVVAGTAGNLWFSPYSWRSWLCLILQLQFMPFPPTLCAENVHGFKEAKKLKGSSSLCWQLCQPTSALQSTSFLERGNVLCYLLKKV